ncbi:NADH:ubiquinone reductase (Na(+)-transporting) subunit C [Puniceibacterium confluentis]|uniref:NADH:ubiquinone reductase (Na(+)-transporting) subunit C n=1 Tax=Puniceibacterium confluentis TaxID=1958944 RepID=UPI0011B46AC3|nr:NADH:ubiquinone reductase (Na(+)-transporting) subunit C [Puniceibacterium confluentis]
MSDRMPFALWRRFLALPNDSRTKTLGVAFLVALVSASTVSLTSVVLKPRQQAHLEAAREAKLAAMIATLPGLADTLRETGAETLETVVVDLASGRIAEETTPDSYDFLAAQGDPAQTIDLTPEQDLAGIGRRPHLAPAYLLRGRDGLALVVLPVYGTGYQSTIRAYLALSADLNTIAGLSIYEQGETPGLGSRITDPVWQALWTDRQAVDPSGEVVISVVRGSASGPSEVDGISGATQSSTGVARLVRFWLGPDGFGPFLDNLRSGESP